MKNDSKRYPLKRRTIRERLELMKQIEQRNEQRRKTFKHQHEKK